MISGGESDYGGIPLKAKKTALLFRGDGPIVTVAGTQLFIRRVAIMDRDKHQRGTIMVIKDVELEQEMLHESLIFNISVAAVSLLLCGLVLGLDFYKIG